MLRNNYRRMGKRNLKADVEPGKTVMQGNHDRNGGGSRFEAIRVNDMDHDAQGEAGGNDVPVAEKVVGSGVGVQRQTNQRNGKKPSVSQNVKGLDELSCGERRVPLDRVDVNANNGNASNGMGGRSVGGKENRLMEDVWANMELVKAVHSRGSSGEGYGRGMVEGVVGQEEGAGVVLGVR